VKVRKVVKSRYVPLVAAAAAFSFLIMMFNIPVPDGTTAHAVGGALVAIILGPWAAVIAVSIALVIQALFFGDGGVLALGANCFNMAFLLPFTSYGVYRLLAQGSPLTSFRRALSAGIAGYVGINVAALAAAIQFGIQPGLFSSADGTPLYAPFDLSQTIPAMAFAHLTIAGIAEFAITFGIVAYLQRANRPVLRINHPAVTLSEAADTPRRLGLRWALIGLGVMVLLTPLGLLAPGGAFGEDAPEELDLSRYHLGAVPSGLDQYAGFWSNTVLGGYGFSSGRHEVAGYLLSALLGTAIIAVSILGVVALVRFVRGRVGPRGPEAESA
jgi:cobalt/nickel transport system permease protein